MRDNIIIEHFWRTGSHGDKTLAQEDIGWPKRLKADAQSDDPETIFRYVVETVGLNLLFYWLEDRNFYTIETELNPIEVRRIYDNPHWDGECEFLKADEYGGGPSTSSPGEVLATFKDETRIWDELRINGVPIGDVLARSCFIDWD